MAVNVDFYTFNKKQNSTARPAGTATTYACNLIEPTSIIAPTIALAVGGNPTASNYARIAEFDRYYFVTDWAFSAGRWVASLSVDVLASWKDYIGAQTQYVTRSSAASDGEIVDTLYPTKNAVVHDFSIGANMEGGEIFTADILSGHYVVGIINADPGATGCVSYYNFSNSQFRALCAKLMGTSDWMYEGIEEIGLELTKVLFNPFQYIASCMWFPTPGGGTGTTVKYGWWDLGVSASTISNKVGGLGVIFDIPKHPQSGRGAYLNGAPFSRYFLDWPCFGRIALDANIIRYHDKLAASVDIDSISGVGTLRIAVNAIPIYTQQAQIGVPIQLAQMAVDYGGVASSVASGVSSALKLDVGGLFNSIGNAIEAAMPQMSTSGKNGSISAYMYDPFLCAEFYEVVNEDNEHLGRPLCVVTTPESIPGYMVCSSAEIEAPCTKAENESVVSYMEGGFYYE